MINQTLKLDHCWICDKTPERDKVKLHEHHVIPRAYGGANGPEVTLCSGCHNLLHDLHHKVKKKGYEVIETGFLNWSLEMREKLSYLVSRVILAESVAKQTANKKVGAYNADTYAMLSRLTKHFSMSQTKTRDYAIRFLYEAVFGKQKP